jgi:hypothetical protein
LDWRTLTDELDRLAGDDFINVASKNEILAGFDQNQYKRGTFGSKSLDFCQNGYMDIGERASIPAIYCILILLSEHLLIPTMLLRIATQNKNRTR